MTYDFWHLFMNMISGAFRKKNNSQVVGQLEVATWPVAPTAPNERHGRRCERHPSHGYQWHFWIWWCNNQLEKRWSSSMGLGWHPFFMKWQIKIYNPIMFETTKQGFISIPWKPYILTIWDPYGIHSMKIRCFSRPGLMPVAQVDRFI